MFYVGCPTESKDSAYAQCLSVAGLGYTSVCHAGRYTDQVTCVLVPVAIGRGRQTWIPGSRHLCRTRQDRHFQASGARPPGSNPPWRGQIYCLAPETLLFKGMPTGPEICLCSPVVSGPRPCTWTHLKQGLVPHLSGRWDVRQMPTESISINRWEWEWTVNRYCRLTL